MAKGDVVLTCTDYEALPADGRRYEVHEGELSVTPVPSPQHQMISRNLFRLLDPHVRAKAASPSSRRAAPRPERCKVLGVSTLERRRWPPWFLRAILGREVILMAIQLATRRFSVREYQHMIDAGVLAEDEHVELLDGVLVPMSPTSPRHAAHVARLGELLRSLLGGRAQVREEKAITLEPATQPEPDLAIVRVRSDFYAGSHPTAGDVLFLIEVADTSLERDRGVKLAVYGAAGIPTAWVLDLAGDRLWVASVPRGSEYADLKELRRSDSDRRLPLPGPPGDLSLAVGDVLGPPR